MLNYIRKKGFGMTQEELAIKSGVGLNFVCSTDISMLDRMLLLLLCCSYITHRIDRTKKLYQLTQAYDLLNVAINTKGLGLS